MDIDVNTHAHVHVHVYIYHTYNALRPLNSLKTAGSMVSLVRLHLESSLWEREEERSLLYQNMEGERERGRDGGREGEKEERKTNQ